MAFKEIKGGGESIDLKKFPGKPLTGKYLGNHTFTTKMGEQVAYEFETEKGTKSIYGFSHLNFLMKNVQVGNVCRITYIGTEVTETKFGKKPVHKCKVEVDDAPSKTVENIKKEFDGDEDPMAGEDAFA
jgi:hypothetical protein